MPPVNSQSDRYALLKTPLGADTLALLDFSGTEYVNDINSFRARAIAQERVDLDQLLGKQMQVDVSTGTTTRSFHQLCFSARYAGHEQGGHAYEFEMRPWIWMMSRRVTSRIFEQKTVIDIVNELYGEYAGLPGAGINILTSRQFPQLEYTVQYNESDLTFMRRLLEEYGVNFHIKMEDGSHSLVLTDSIDSFDMARPSTATYNPSNRAAISSDLILTSWADQRQVTSGAIRSADYDFQRPSNGLDTQDRHGRGYQGADYEVYEYPGGYPDQGVGNDLMRRRMAALRSNDQLVRTDGNIASAAAGTRIQVTGAAEAGANGTYAVLQASHHFGSNVYRSGAGGDMGYHGDYLLTKESHPLAPARVTPRPIMQGPQTAVVSRGAEDVIDEYGRIWVTFFWDRNAHSMPCRVSQAWAGPQWGTVFIPRVGMEVIVEFLHGDPDNPIITGCVYNGENMPPWPLPAKKQVSGIKTQTMGGSGYNELSFDDTAGSEQIVMHAQKDLNATVLNNALNDIKVDNTKKVGGNQTTTIQGTQSVTVTKSSTLTSNDSIKIEATNKIELVCGMSKITMTPQKVTITAISIEASATADIKTTGLTAQYGATVDLAIQSAIVRINS